MFSFLQLATIQTECIVKAMMDKFMDIDCKIGKYYSSKTKDIGAGGKKAMPYHFLANCAKVPLPNPKGLSVSVSHNFEIQDRYYSRI